MGKSYSLQWWSSNLIETSNKGELSFFKCKFDNNCTMKKKEMCPVLPGFNFKKKGKKKEFDVQVYYYKHTLTVAN